MRPAAVVAVDAGIVGNPHTACSTKDKMIFHLLRDCRRVFGKFAGDTAKGFSFIQHGFDDESIVESEMFMFRHDGTSMWPGNRTT